MKALFYPYRTTVRASAHPATITDTNPDGTVNLISHDGWDTPQEGVPVFDINEDHTQRQTGFYANLIPDEDTDLEVASYGPSGEDDAQEASA
jgi:hypothetical protein